MANHKTYKRNDTGPPAIITCTDGPDEDTQTPVNLTGCTVKFLMGTINAAGVANIKVNGIPTISDAANGIVTYNWAAGDLDNAGEYKAEVEVTFPGNIKETFPNDGYLTITVIADVG